MESASSGVPQGSVLGPLLFLSYINDLARALECPGYMFADDVKLVGCPSEQSMQRDLDRIYQWTVDWDLPLNNNKCQLLTLNESTSTRTLGCSGAQSSVPNMKQVRDLGVMITGDFKSTSQCIEAARKGNAALYRLKRTVASRDPKVLVPLYKAFVRPHLEYCVQAWRPALQKDIKKLEGVQRAFTRVFPNLRQLAYDSRLHQLDLFSLERRRLRGDLIEAFKMMTGLSDAGGHMFTHNESSALRGHELKLVKNRARLDIRQNSFAFRIVNDWNRLPSSVVTATSVPTFKHRLDNCWLQTFPDTP